jgi:hypothetical protein
MSEHQFQELKRALIRRGVAVRYAKRAALEIEAHYGDLLEQALARGDSPEQASRCAHEALGTNDVLIERFASRKELQSWSHRWPAGYAVAPVLCFGGLCAVLLFALLWVLRAMSGFLHHVELTSAATEEINLAVVVFFLWVLPIAVSMGFGLLAYRQCISLRWPVVGVLLLCAVAEFLNVSAHVTGGSHPGWFSGGIGIATNELPSDIAGALGKAAIALILLAWIRHRSMSSGPLLN